MSLCREIREAVEVIKNGEVVYMKKSKTYRKTKTFVIEIIGTSPIIIIGDKKFINNLYKDLFWLETLYGIKDGVKELYESAIEYYSRDEVIKENKYLKEFMGLAKKSFSEEVIKYPDKKKGYFFRLKGIASRMFKIINDEEASQKMFNFLLEIAKSKYLYKNKG